MHPQVRNVKHVGLHAYRLSKKANNPREVAFAEQWQLEQDQGQLLSKLLGDGTMDGFYSQVHLADREIQVAATVIQWLGSNVGMSFLEEAVKRNPGQFEEFLRKFRV